MADAFYRVLIACSRRMGLWVVRMAAAIVATGYFFFTPRRLSHSVKTYRALFPERGRVYAVRCAWRQYQDFASVYSERLEVERAMGGETRARSDPSNGETRAHSASTSARGAGSGTGEAVACEHDGSEYLTAARAAKTGAVLLMSHFGRWELAARMLPGDLGRLVVVMGTRGDEDAVPQALHRGGIDVRAVSESQASAAGIFDAVTAIREGALVSMAGDRPWGASRTMRLPFLGYEVVVNVAPFALALATGAPWFAVFAYRAGERRYKFVCSPPRHVRAASRAERDAAIRAAGLAYLAELERMMRAHPEQWHTFGVFLRTLAKQGTACSCPSTERERTARGHPPF